MKTKRIVITFGLALVLIGSVFALVFVMGCLEPKMTYQGVLTNAQGTPMPDGIYSATFRLWNADANKWVFTETKTITVTNGVFSTVLGETFDLPVKEFAQTLELEISVEGDTLSPRQRLYGAPYAFSLIRGARIIEDRPNETTLGIINASSGGTALYLHSGGTALAAKGKITCTESSYIWIPGTQAVQDTDETNLVILYGVSSGTAYFRATYTGTYYVFIPIDVPGVLYGQNVTVEEVRIYYKVENSADYIDFTRLTKNTGAGTHEQLAFDDTNYNSTTATYYTLTPTANNVLDSSAGGLSLIFLLHFAGTGFDREILIGGVRVKLSHY
jgi:hypothetical protein